ncbi:MAG: hypothetical protein FWE53_02585 [Firmicutes bacterium]|nr:hypothetical protein [Bacillota bacterium]
MIRVEFATYDGAVLVVKKGKVTLSEKDHINGLNIEATETGVSFVLHNNTRVVIGSNSILYPLMDSVMGEGKKTCALASCPELEHSYLKEKENGYSHNLLSELHLAKDRNNNIEVSMFGPSNGKNIDIDKGCRVIVRAGKVPAISRAVTEWLAMSGQALAPLTKLGKAAETVAGVKERNWAGLNSAKVIADCNVVRESMGLKPISTKNNKEEHTSGTTNFSLSNVINKAIDEALGTKKVRVNGNAAIVESKNDYSKGTLDPGFDAPDCMSRKA